jgi:adenylate cyclase
MNAMNSVPAMRLRLFGSPSIERPDGTAVTGRAVQRHRLALLALLALAPSRRLSRDRLMAWLWPEADAERARSLLNTSTYILRTALGDGALLSTGDDLRLDGELVLSDAAEFEAAVAREDHELAAALHVAPFLDGFFLPDAPELEDWIGRERQRLAALYGKAVEALAEREEAAGRHAAAAERWQARAALDPWDSRVAVRLMQALAASGNRGGALQVAASHQQRLRDELGVESAPEVARLADRLRRAAGAPDPPGSPSAAVAPAGSLSAEAPPAAEAGPPAAMRHSAPRRVATAVLVAVTALALVAWLVRSRGAVPERSIAVLPFANQAPGGGRDFFTDGLADEIIGGLATVPGLTVTARTSAMAFETSVAPLPEIARDLKVAHVLYGTVRREGSRVQVTARLVAAAEERVLWARNYQGDVGNLAEVQERIAQDVARALEVRLAGDGTQSIVRQGTRDPDALEMYRRGRWHWTTRTRAGHEQAIAYFQRAIAIDSGYSDAWAGLADAHLTGWQLGATDATEEEARTGLIRASERALSLDDRSADAHASFAVALWWQRNWPGAERELRRAIELNPSHATARGWYSILLAGLGRQEEAVREARRAAELDPFALMVVITYGWQCYVARDWACAIEQYERTLELNPEWSTAARALATVFALQGRHAEAREMWRKGLAMKSGQYLVGTEAVIQALAGDTASARASLRAVAGTAEPFALARAWAVLGERDSAFAALERTTHWVWPHRALLADPLLDGLRGDPRLAALQERIDREMGVR